MDSGIHYFAREDPSSQTLPHSTIYQLQTMDTKFGRVNHSLSTNPNYSGLFNTDYNVDLDDLDCETIDPLSLEVINPHMEETLASQLTSSSENFMNTPVVSSSLLPETDSYDISSPESNVNMSSSSLRDDHSVISHDFDLFSMLLDEDAPLDHILEQMEEDAVAKNQQAQTVKLDHDYVRKDSSDASLVSAGHRSSCASSCVRKVTADSSSRGKKKDETDNARRIRNNEASRRSRALKKQKFKGMESDVQRLAAENQRMRVLLKDMDLTAKRCKELLVSSLSSKKLPFS